MSRWRVVRRLMVRLLVSQREIVEYRQILEEINRLSQEDLVALFRRLQFEDPQALYEALRLGVPEVVAEYQAMAADTAAVFYENTQGVGFDVGAVRAASVVDRDALESSIRWAVFSPASKNVLGRLSGVLQKHIMSGSRNYVLEQESFRRSGWYRHAQPGACAFCRMLATRSARDWRPYTGVSAEFTGEGNYARKGDRALREQGEKFHDHCRCVPVLAEDYEVPSYVEKWDEEYERAAKLIKRSNGSRSDFKGILSLMRADGGDGDH